MRKFFSVLLFGFAGRRLHYLIWTRSCLREKSTSSSIISWRQITHLRVSRWINLRSKAHTTVWYRRSRSITPEVNNGCEWQLWEGNQSDFLDECRILCWSLLPDTDSGARIPNLCLLVVIVWIDPPIVLGTHLVGNDWNALCDIRLLCSAFLRNNVLRTCLLPEWSLNEYEVRISAWIHASDAVFVKN